MNFKEFIKKRYNIVRNSESFLISLLIHALILIAMTFVVIAGSEKVAKTLTFQKEKKKVKAPPPPKPVVLPKNLSAPPPPKSQPLQQVNKRMVVKKQLNNKFKPKKIAIKPRKMADFKEAAKVGKIIHNTMNRDYSEKFGVEGYGTGLKAKIEQFVIVKYLGGDWDCEFFHRNGKPVMKLGSIPNLIFEIERRTNIEVVNDIPVVVAADSPEIHKSPFVYFTGHNDFTLTEAEVENLRTYILQGGAIVANSALPGRRSRFDLAFRRELGRIMPNYALKPIGPKNDIYKAYPAHSFNQIPPEGMNYWREPLEIIEIDGRVRVIYNLNDYGELMLATLDDSGSAIKRGESVKDEGYWFEGHMVRHNPNAIFANVGDVDTILDAYMMNVNVLAYLLTR